VDAVAPSLRNPGSAKYRWAKFPTVVTEDSVNYCATVDAQSEIRTFLRQIANRYRRPMVCTCFLYLLDGQAEHVVQVKAADISTI
jgi:hypothetical protein